MTDYYKEDLTYIHDVGYSEYALNSAAGILTILAQNKIHDGFIVDLGCGTGLSAAEFIRAGYQVLGIDISESMITLAKIKVPSADFRVASLFKTEIPPCTVVTAIGECFNYLFDSDNDEHQLLPVFEQIYHALTPGGILIFDIAEPGQVDRNDSQHFNEGNDWLILVEKKENLEQSLLTRRIITIRKVSEHYRRDDEIHTMRLYRSTDIAQKLRQVGFKVQTTRSYDQFRLPKAHAAFIARKVIN
ncbi:methyltransferase type 11 [Leptolyngbya sp. Heron Island J]|uniref:class I SAM-dependent DNA methyltransferase n=1 Tax=Leptolyngbya sp. Heron Island J TaxID=1385935 RepID=UPI0003B951E1|nr:class I SAM-dependent methyltransferase [Leptolyngbya sp. Heron Island J]ESA32940.1 methyltransferase type 11 [Leptolyngbya sp. Heron Island J]